MAKLKQIRWTIDIASKEFGVARQTLSKRIIASGIIPGLDDKFSTLDICHAVFSNLEVEKTGLTIEQKELTRIRKLQAAKKLCVLETVTNVWHSALVEMRQKISNWPIADALKQELIRELQDINTDEYFPADAPSPEIGDEADV